MPIYKGVNKIASIYKGEDKIAKVYKGANLVYSSAYWLSYSFTYLYNSLIPTTISGKQVKDKAKVYKIEANGEIVNQLVQNGNFEDTSNWVVRAGTFTVENGIGTLTQTASNYTNYIGQDRRIIQGHKYFASIKAKRNTSNTNMAIGFAYGWTTQIQSIITISMADLTTDLVEYHGFLESSYNNNRIILGISTYVSGSLLSVSFTDFICVDLTQMFGAGNEPTTLTDNRIQKILNQGYIAYNEGEYKGTDISEFSTTKTDTTALDTLPFIYQGDGVGTAHDSMEITPTDYIFTKNVANVDLGRLNWTKGTGIIYSNSIGIKANNANIPNVLTTYNAQPLISFNSFSNNPYPSGIAFRETGVTYIRDSNYSDLDVLISSLIGKTVTYELATPQVISIPKKHLGIVRIRDLRWSAYNTNRFRTDTGLTNIKVPDGDNLQANIYCSEFITSTYARVNGGTVDLQMGIGSPSGRCIAIDKSCNTVTDFLNKYGDYYIFYETSDEVADIDTQIKIEAGGTLTSDSEVLPNVTFKIKCK